MLQEREEFSFSPDGFGIMSTEEISAGEAFLNSDPNDLKYVPKKPKEESEDEEEEEEDTSKKPTKKKDKTLDKEPPKKQLSEDNFFSAMEQGDGEEEEEEGENEEKDSKLPKSKEEGGSSEEKDEDVSEEEENVYSTIAAELLNHGIFNLDEGEEELEIDTPEELLTRFQLESRKQAAEVVEKFIGKHGDDYRDMFENVFVRGVHPIEYLNRYAKIESVKDIDLGDESNQERLVRDLYRSEGKSAEYIEKRLTQLKNYNDLLDEATEAKRVLLEKEENGIEEEVERKRLEQEAAVQKRNSYINSIGRILSDKMKAKEFDGIPIDKKFAEQTFSYITQERFQTPDGQLLTTFDRDILELNRPENHELKIKVSMLLQMLREDPELKKLARKAVSKDKSELFKDLKKTAVKRAKAQTPKEEEQPASWFQ